MKMFNPYKKQRVPQTTFVEGIGRMPFPAYRGNGPYIFISYAHVDSELVFPEIKDFNKNGYNVWYDEGISPGNEWTDEIADFLEGSSLFVVLITPASASSPNVLNEINYAIDEKKPFVAIHLKKTTLRAGIKLQIGTKQAILKYNMTDEEYLYKYTSAFERLGIKRNKGYDAQDKNLETHSMDLEMLSEKNTMSNSIASTHEELVKIGDFLIEHGLLRDYLGTSPDIKLPDEVQIIGSSSFAKGASIIEMVDLNQTGALLNNAFVNCPNLREITLPCSITTIQERAFVNCPKLTLYCQRSQLPENFEKNYGGKDIIYIEEK